MSAEPQAIPYSIETNIPAGIRFADGQPAQGWGRILKCSQDAVELETHFPVRENSKIFLTFAVEGFYEFGDLPLKVAGFRNMAYATVAICSLDSADQRGRWKEALLYLVDRNP